MVEITLVENDIQYLAFYLKVKDPVSGSITPYDLSDVSAIVFRMRKYGETANAIETTCEIVDASKGYCRALVTIPPAGTYYSEVEVFELMQHITWIGPTYIVKPQLG
jgi:hypothetical protein